ncbi:MAG: adventurous gliding motility protein CglE [Cystobacterineae bacterium]|nr:adventurous gliding motility protein CglE [Cystobacterineae bacterium]
MRFRLAFLTFLLPLSLAFAQETGSVHETERVPLKEVERGVYLQLQGGAWYLLEAPTPKGVKGPKSFGHSLQIEFGYDLGERLSLGVILLGTFNPASSSYRGQSEEGNASGGFSSLTPGLSLKVGLVGFGDSQSVQRTWFYARAAIGASFFFPKVLLPKIDYLANVGIGVEYYTRLRHFSVGLEASGIGLLRAGTFGFAITPSLRYAF